MLEFEVMKSIQDTNYTKRYSYYELHQSILERELEYDVAQIIVDVVAAAITNSFPVLTAARKIISRISNLMELEEYDETTQLRYGCECINYLAKLGVIDAEKYVAIDKSEAKEQYFIVSLSQEFTEYATSILPSKSMLSPTEGPIYWNSPMIFKNGHRIPIVKKAERYNLLSNYVYDKMPDVYNSLNKLNRQCFKISKRVLPLTETTQGYTFPFVPSRISEDERKMALHSINDVSRKARFIEEIRFEEMNKWLADVDATIGERKSSMISRKRASEKSQDYFDTKVEPFIQTISDWSKRLDFEKIILLADGWKESTINFLFNMDTRGRIYAVQNYLTPLGSDLAKAMLVFEDPQQVSGFDLCIHIANCFGKDKLSFEDRVAWVNENSASLYLIGDDPIGNYEVIEELELDKEKKTKWQGVAACQVYRDYCDHIETNGDEEGFMSDLIVGLDSTASGTQILTILGRDDKVAPYVNVSASHDGNVGDFYTYLSNYLKPKLELHRGTSDTLDAILDDWNPYSRKLSKRNSMTFVYSGTKYGFGEQHWQDRHDYGSLGSELTRSDCRLVGNAMYEVCEENIRGGAEIMEWLRDGVDHHQGGAIISWTMPDGFTAFQVADKSKKSQLKVEIGTRTIQLVYYTFRDIPDVRSHKNGISPNWVHAYDAYLLRLIVNGMPDEAPISTVHDQFSTSSYYIQELQEVAKVAYKTIGDRDVAEAICAEAFGIHRSLPLVGTWELDEIDNAEFIIC